MRLIFSCLILTTLSAFAQSANNIYQIPLKTIEGKPQSLEAYRGKVLMIVNTASQCGYTPQLKDLVELQRQYGPQGFQVLAFPSNDFKQDKGSNEQTKKFSEETYHINFPLFDKGPVTGDDKQPLYKFLESKSKDFPSKVLWNFEKFLVSREGEVIERYRSGTSPSSESVKAQIEKLLSAKK